MFSMESLSISSWSHQDMSVAPCHSVLQALQLNIYWRIFSARPIWQTYSTYLHLCQHLNHPYLCIPSSHHSPSLLTSFLPYTIWASHQTTNQDVDFSVPFLVFWFQNESQILVLLDWILCFEWHPQYMLDLVYLPNSVRYSVHWKPTVRSFRCTPVIVREGQTLYFVDFIIL